MFLPGALPLMAPKKKKSAGGRPRSPKPMRSLISLKGTDDLEKWLDGVVDETRQGTRTLLLKNALFEFAKNHGIAAEMPKR